MLVTMMHRYHLLQLKKSEESQTYFAQNYYINQFSFFYSYLTDDDDGLIIPDNNLNEEANNNYQKRKF